MRLDNEIAAAEDDAKLAKIKDLFYKEQLGVVLLLMVVICKTVRDECIKPSDPKAINTEPANPDKEQNVVEHTYKRVSDEQFMLLESLREDPPVIKVPLSASTPNQPVLPVLNYKEIGLSPNATLYVKASLPKQDYLTGYPCFPASATESMTSRLTTSIDSIVTRSSHHPLDVVKFSGDPCEYFRFKARFYEMVEFLKVTKCLNCYNSLMVKLNVL